MLKGMRYLLLKHGDNILDKESKTGLRMPGHEQASVGRLSSEGTVQGYMDTARQEGSQAGFAPPDNSVRRKQSVTADEGGFHR